MSVEALLGTDVAFAAAYQLARPHPGQIAVAAELRHLLRDSGLQRGHHGSAHKVQDPYSLRCVPQVHGAVRDALDHLRRVLDIELNSATDNPLVFPGGGVADEDTIATGGGRVISGGNFHGEPIALALDFAKLALAELGSISERRTALLVDHRLNGGLPPFLAHASGRRVRDDDLPVHGRGPRARAQGAGPPGVRRLHPDVGEPGGPRLDGLDRGATRPVGADRRRADHRHRAVVAAQALDLRLAALAAEAARGEAPGDPAPAWPRHTGGSARASRTSTAIASPGRTSRPRRPWSTTGCWRTSPDPGPGVTDSAAGAHRHRRRHRRGDLRPPAALRGSRVRPPLVRLLGGRRSRVEDDPARLDRAAPRRRLRMPPRSAPANPVPRRSRGARRSGPNPFAVGASGRAVEPAPRRRRPARRQPVRAAPRRSRPSVPAARRASSGSLAAAWGSSGAMRRCCCADDVPAAYCQFGPLTAYPRAQRTRDLYPALPDAPLPAVITCIAIHRGSPRCRPGQGLVAAVCDDLEARGFAAVETYPEIGGTAGRHERRDARRSGRRSGSSSPRPTSASRSCAASSA